MKKFLAVVSFAALLCPSPSAAAVIPIAQLLVNGVDSGILFDWQQPAPDLFTLNYADTTGQSPLQSLRVTADIDPFLDYSLTFINPLDHTIPVSLTILMPYAGGPYDLVILSHSSTVGDGLRDGGTLGLDLQPHIANALLDFVTVTGLSTGCAIAPAAVGQTCFSGPDSTVGVLSGPTGVFGVQVNFTLTAFDAYSASGRVTLTSVPEPATLLLIGTGIAAIVRRRVAS